MPEAHGSHTPLFFILVRLVPRRGEDSPPSLNLSVAQSDRRDRARRVQSKGCWGAMFALGRHGLTLQRCIAALPPGLNAVYCGPEA